MTSLATLILKLNQLTKQSEFYLSQYLGALIHLPRVWRNLHVELHLTALTGTILQLTRQLRVSSLIRIGAPPLLKLTPQTPELKADEETQLAQATIPLDLATLQKPLTILQERALGSPKPLQAITHTLFQTKPKAHPTLPMQIYSAAKSEGVERTLAATPREPLQAYLPLKDEAPAEENLRENVVERWLQQQEATGRRPVMSFVEAHKLYRDLFEEFVATSILPPNLFAERFLETPHNLTFEQARTDLRVRVNAPPTPKQGGTNIESQPEATKQIYSILLPSYITSTLWAKGSLSFGGPPESSALSLLRLTPSSFEASDSPTASIFSDIIQRDKATTPPASESSIASPDRIYQETKDAKLETDFRGLAAETNPNNTEPIRSLLTEEPSTDHSNADRELESHESYSEDHRLVTSPYQSKQNFRVYSPAAALLSTLASHATTAFISPTQGNGHRLPLTPASVALKPSFAIDRGPQTLIHTDMGHLFSKTEESVIDRFERILPTAESHPTPLYLRPPMNLPAVASAMPQRSPTTMLPSSNIASTRETSTNPAESKEEEIEEEEMPEGYPEDEDEAEEAAMREQLKKMGKIIAEEARRHIGSD